MLNRLRKYLPCRHYWVPVVELGTDDAGNFTASTIKYHWCLKCDRHRTPKAS